MQNLNIKKLKSVLHQMGYRTETPTTCIVVNGQRKCGLIERSNLEGEERLYIQDKIFRATYYTKIPPKIYKLTKQGTDTVTFYRRGTKWTHKTITVQPYVKQLVIEKTQTEMKNSEIIKNAIQDKINYLKSMHATYDENKIAIETISLCYRDLYLQTLKKYMNSDFVLKLRETTHKDIASDVTTTDGVVTHEIMRLPPVLQNCDLSELEVTFKDHVEFSN